VNHRSYPNALESFWKSFSPAFPAGLKKTLSLAAPASTHAWASPLEQSGPRGARVTEPEGRVPRITAQEEASLEPRALSAASPSPGAHPLLPQLPTHISGAGRAGTGTEPLRGCLHPRCKVESNTYPTAETGRMDGQMDRRKDR